MFGPVLRGVAVTLRPTTREDLPRFVSWLADTEITRFLGRLAPPSMEQEEEWFKRSGEQKDSVLWAIEAGGALVGSIGIHEIDWLNRHAFTGILIGDKAQWGKGIATEAMALRTRYAFRELNLHKLKTYVFVDNEASRKALAKSGYRQVGIWREEMWRDGRWHDLWIGEVLRADWERQYRGPA